MLCDDFGGYAPRDPKDQTIDTLKRKVSDLEKENLELFSQLNAFNQAPLRRLWNGFKRIWSEWFGVAIMVLIVGIGAGTAYFAIKYRVANARGSCEFAAKIQETKFEFDTYNEKCYLYDKSFNKYIPHSTATP